MNDHLNRYKPKSKREKRFWKYRIGCKPEAFREDCIQSLSLRFLVSDITDEELGYLAPFMLEVEEVNLTDTKITDYGIAHLSNLPNLKYLRLKDTLITSKCIPDLVKIKSLKHLHIGSMDTTCAELIPLAELEMLETLIARPSDFNLEDLRQIKTKRPSLDLIIQGKTLPF